MADSGYIREHSPSANPLEDLLGLLRWWAESARPAADPAKLGAFMDYFADEWHVSWDKGAPEAMLSWFESCATDDLGSEGGGYRIYGLDVPDQRYGEVALAGIPGFWDRYGVLGSVIEIGVSGFLHVIGKASDGEFFYLGHV